MTACHRFFADEAKILLCEASVANFVFKAIILIHMEHALNADLFAAVPDEILVKILQYVSVLDVPAVCRIDKRVNELTDINMKQEILDYYLS